MSIAHYVLDFFLYCYINDDDDDDDYNNFQKGKKEALFL